MMATCFRSLLLFSLFWILACTTKVDSSISISEENFPLFDFNLKNGAYYTASQEVEVINSSNRNDIESMSLTLGSECQRDTWQAYNDSMVVDLGSVEGEKTLSMMIKTKYGFKSKCVTKKYMYDKTPPTGPAIMGWNFSSLTETPPFELSGATDQASGLKGFEFALGTAPGLNDVLGWRFLDSNAIATISGLSLTSGNLYFPSVRSIDKSGLKSSQSNEAPFRAMGTWKNHRPQNAPVFIGNNYEGQPTGDGKTYIGGNFSVVSKPSLMAARLNSNGARDFSFNTGDFNGGVKTAIYLPDGKILLGGNFTTYNGQPQNRILRLNADSTKDSSFNIGQGFNNYIWKVLVQADGKILVAGVFTAFNGAAANAIVRLNADGSRDASFQLGTGFSITGATAEIYDMAIQPDGRILTVGNFYSYNGASAMRIARLNPNGTLDNTLSVGQSFNGTTIAVTLDSNGKIYVGGIFGGYNGIPQNCVVRLNSDGSLDTTFAVGTRINSGAVYSLALQSDGKILIGGTFVEFAGSPQLRLARLTSTGELDTTFNLGTSFNGMIKSIVIQPDNKILVGGEFSSFNGTSAGRIARLNGDGSKDASFLSGTGFNVTVDSILVTQDSKILVTGTFTTYQMETSRHRLIRLDSNSQLDATFNNDLNFNGIVWRIVPLADGKVLVAGDFTQVNSTTVGRIVRLNIDGTIDSSFSIGQGFDGWVNSVVAQSDGKILCGGDFNSFNGGNQAALVRLNSDGSLDTSFSNPSGWFNTNIEQIVIDNDGKIMVVGGFTQFGGAQANRILRLNKNGTRDNSFNIGLGLNSSGFSLATQKDGKYIVGGAFTSYNGLSIGRIVRINGDGSVDSSFKAGTGFDNAVMCIAVQSDDKIIIGGAFTSYGGINKNFLLRLEKNGLMDSRFDVGTGPDSSILSLKTISDGRIILGGGNLDWFNGNMLGSFMHLGW